VRELHEPPTCRGRHSRPLQVGLALVLLVGALSSCSRTAQQSGPDSKLSSLVWAGVDPGTRTGVNYSLPKGARSASFGGLNLCSRDAALEVTGVRLENSNGLKLERWRVRNGTSTGLGSSVRDLATEGFPAKSEPVTFICPTDMLAPISSYPSELGVQVSIIDGDFGTSDALLVAYRNGHRNGQLRLNFALALCTPADTKPCAG
jgi:hypothetical protein